MNTFWQSHRVPNIENEIYLSSILFFEEGRGKIIKLTQNCKALGKVKMQQMHEVTDSVYYGETSRSLMTRAENQFKDYQTHTDISRRKPASSWMWDHTESQHGGVISNNIRDDYTFKI